MNLDSLLAILGLLIAIPSMVVALMDITKRLNKKGNQDEEDRSLPRDPD